MAPESLSVRDAPDPGGGLSHREGGAEGCPRVQSDGVWAWSQCVKDQGLASPVDPTGHLKHITVSGRVPLTVSAGAGYNP